MSYNEKFVSISLIVKLVQFDQKALSLTLLGSSVPFYQTDVNLWQEPKNIVQSILKAGIHQQSPKKGKGELSLRDREKAIHPPIIGRFSNETGTSDDDWKAHGIAWILF